MNNPEQDWPDKTEERRKGLLSERDMVIEILSRETKEITFEVISGC